MKNVAKHDMYCELQNSVSHQIFERKLQPVSSRIFFNQHVVLNFRLMKVENTSTYAYLRQQQVTYIRKWSGLKKEYPQNLSILISGGNETNKDICSNGEWNRCSSNFVICSFNAVELYLYHFAPAIDSAISTLECVSQKGDTPVVAVVKMLMGFNDRVGLLGNAALSWW